MRLTPHLKSWLFGGLMLVTLEGCLHRPAPQPLVVRPGLTSDVGPRLSNYSQATVPADGLIVVAGDDFAGPGQAPAAAKGKPAKSISFADALADATGLKVADETRPGDTIQAGAKRIESGPAGNLLVISYGYGDAAAHSDLGQFQLTLQHMIRRAHDRGAAVYLLVEPANLSPLSTAVEPSRNVVRGVAASEGAGLIDAPVALAKAELGPSKTKIQPYRAVMVMAGLVAEYVNVAPSTGAARSDLTP